MKSPEILDCTKYLSKNTQPKWTPLAKGRGCTVIDINGKKYLDFGSQTLNLNLGHCHPKIINAVKRQLNKIYYTSSRFSDIPTLLLAKKLIQISPHGLSKVNLKMAGGSEANEYAIKTARKYHNKNIIATTYCSFFGETFETMRCSGDYFNKKFIGSKKDYLYVLPPYCFRCPYDKISSNCNLYCAESFEKLLQERDDVAAIMIEPINVNAGVIISPNNYLKKLRSICDEYDVTLIFDEVQTGFGWLGDMFASNYYEVVPDILTLAKGLSAGFPLGAVLIKEKYDVLEYGEHEFTYGAHPISCVAALENIKILTEKKFLVEVKNKGDYLRTLLLELLEDFDCIGDVRAIGLLGGVEIVDKTGKSDPMKAIKIQQESMVRGVILRVSDVCRKNTIIVKPPLTVSKDEIDIAVNILRKAIKVTNA